MNKCKILLADDSAAIRKVVELAFTEEGMDVTVVGDGDAAMNAFVENQPDVVIADVHMPGASGLQICEMIKQDESTRSIPVILLSGSYEPFDPQQAESVGADFFFTKPFASIRQVVDKVHDLMGERAIHEGPRADTDDIEGLYRESFVDPTPEAVEQTVAELGYVGMDDLRGEEQDSVRIVEESEDKGLDALRSAPADSETEPSAELLDESSFDDETIEITRPNGEAAVPVDPFAAPATATESPVANRTAPLKMELDESAGHRVLSNGDISPELMDDIVRRVVEKLSASVIREVAEETVPRITKQLLREALNKDLDLTS